MNSIRVFNQRVGYMIMAAAMLLTVIVPALVSADQVTERSIALSNSSASMTGATYQVNFTSVAAAGAFVVDFCSNTPLIGEECTPPTGFNATTASSTTSGFTDVEGATSKFVVTGTIAAETAISVDVAGITNPTNAGPLYARILTYTDADGANGYESEDIDAVAAPLDEGGLAISITDTVGVSGAVLESMTFCVAKIAITEDCGNAAANPPVLPLGETVPGTDILALNPDTLSSGNLYTQISTNAVSGAIIRLKTGATCGGLKRVGVATCDIAPALTGGVAAGQAKFGVKTAAATSTTDVDDATGTIQPVAISGYNGTTYVLNYAQDNLSGVTSAYGDPFLDTDDAPVNNKNMQLTFGASVSNDTPAGLYSADVSMIATGKF